MEQTTLHSNTLCPGRLVLLGACFGFALLLLWQVAGPTAMGHALVWSVGIVAGVKFWRAIEGA